MAKKKKVVRKNAPASSGWIPCSGVKFTKQNGKSVVLVRKAGKKRATKKNAKRKRSLGENRKIRRASGAKRKHYEKESYKRAYLTPGKGLHKNKARKLKFGSPAWRKKYMKKGRR